MNSPGVAVGPSTVPARKLVATLLSRKPKPSASTITLASALVVVFITLVGWYRPSVGSLLPVSGDAFFNLHEWWRPWSACFAHADMAHLLSNLVLFVAFGYFLSGYFGAWLFPLWSFVLGGLANLLVLRSYPPEVSVLGASGVVNVLGGIWLSLFFGISRQYRMPGRILRTLGVALMLFAPQEFRPEVAERVHASGLFCGLVFGGLWFLIFKDRIRSYEVWEDIPPEDPLDDLPPPEGVEVLPYEETNRSEEENGRQNFQVHIADVQRENGEDVDDEKNRGGSRGNQGFDH